jgi:hypothetical protein
LSPHVREIKGILQTGFEEWYSEQQRRDRHPPGESIGEERFRFTERSQEFNPDGQNTSDLLFVHISDHDTLNLGQFRDFRGKFPDVAHFVDTPGENRGSASNLTANTLKSWI